MKRASGEPPAPSPSPSPSSRSTRPSTGGQVVELSRFRAELSRGRRVRRAESLAAAPDPRLAIRALPADEFYYVLAEVGFPEATEILQHGTPEQVQTALDFALWDRDRLDPAATEIWLEAMSEAPVFTIGAWGQGLDIELLALLLRGRTRIYDLSQEEPPDEPEGTLWASPDRLFVLDLLGDEDQRRVTQRLLDALYRTDHEWVRRILVGTRGELDAELEEHAYRWRSGRMADLGFEDYYSALEVYREIDPASVQLGEQPAPRVLPLGETAGGSYLRMPTALAERLAEASPFSQAVAGIQDRDELANLQAALVTLANRVLAADRITPGDEAAAAEVLARMAATLDLAVELLARGDAASGVTAVRTIPLARLFQLGVTLIGKVRRLAVALLRRTPYALARPPLNLFEDVDLAVLEPTSRLRPLFPRPLDRPPAEGVRPFASLADLQSVTVALERAGAAITLLHGLGLRPENLAAEADLRALGVADAAALDAGLLARTVLARHLLGLPAGAAALDPGPLARLQDHFLSMRQDPEKKKDFEERSVAFLLAAWPQQPPSAAATSVAARWALGLAAGEPVLTRAAPGDAAGV